MPEKWRLIYNPEGDIADILAYPSALAEGRVAGKYMLSSGKMPDTVVIQGVKKRGILAGADVSVDRAAAKKHDVDVALSPRTGKRGAKPAGTVQLEEIVGAASKKYKAAAIDPDEPAVLLYTSGTTGQPKGVMLTHRNFNSQCSGIVSHIFPLETDDRITGVLPLYHVYALANGLVSAVYFGATLSLIPQYSPAALLDNIVSNKATILIAIPSMYMHLLTLARVRKAEIPKTLKQCISGGAPLPASVLSDFERVFHTRIAEGYGLTETTSSVCLNRSSDGFKPGSIGPAAPGVEMKIVDDEGNDLPDGQTGEIIIKGAVVTKGYWNNAQDTASTIKDGWLYTGDIGYRDHDGYFFITDRKKDLIIRGGYNISPREIEELLIAHKKVTDAAVIGVKDKRDEETVKAFVVKQPGETVSEKEIIEYCSENLAPYKVPKSVEFREMLPKSPAGKVLKKELRAGYVDIRLMQKEDTDRKGSPG